MFLYYQVCIKQNFAYNDFRTGSTVDLFKPSPQAFKVLQYILPQLTVSLSEQSLQFYYNLL
jgi:hypothetical protein